MKARISGRALNDLDGIFAHISVRQGFEAADRFLALAKEGMEFLAQNPLADPPPKWATRHKTLRFWVIRGANFLIYYLPDEQNMSMERVLDGRRDVARITEFDGEEGATRRCHHR